MRVIRYYPKSYHFILNDFLSILEEIKKPMGKKYKIDNQLLKKLPVGINGHKEIRKHAK